MNPVLLKPQSEVGAQLVVQGNVYGRAKRRRLPGDQARADAVRAGQLRAAEGRSRHRSGRRRGQRVGDQSARQRHRQYGLRPRRRRAGGADRRHRPRRGDRQPGRHQGGDRRRRRGADQRLPGQQVPRRPGAVRQRHGADRGGDRLGAARPHSLPRRSAAAAGGGCARAGGSAAGQDRSAPSRSPFRCCRISPISTISIRSTPSRAVELVRVRPGNALPGDADLVILPGSKATIADLAALRQAGFDIDIARASPPRRQRARSVRRLSDARPRGARPRRDRRAARNRNRAWSARCRDHARGGETAREGRGHLVRRRARRGLRDAYGR